MNASENPQLPFCTCSQCREMARKAEVVRVALVRLLANVDRLDFLWREVVR